MPSASNLCEVACGAYKRPLASHLASSVTFSFYFVPQLSCNARAVHGFPGTEILPNARVADRCRQAVLAKQIVALRAVQARSWLGVGASVVQLNVASCGPSALSQLFARQLRLWIAWQPCMYIR